ncbi:ABC transporter ATP-binding protein [Amycolatopsis regifaucium]|uniref:ABC transporter ATP-binding protein n=1 Tax=Amycolatopsis regifaucium TaxID=546365 RepID=A0A154MMB7_9PSEU|nr:ABC transporter ATP-binding protein [Amycolatopsis regifaucium]KZB85411.1 ABC transporter ATP-binding protein [Amycolatopsis regifaucium]OKA08980.1 ABC transporter ATP-binding protein [Amycolatopsis regifaucium]SFJ37968.1 ABC-2 type transport system ATP-binding protein [Amycolatopsis regifaucium]
MREQDITTGAAVRLSGLRKHYGDVHAVDGVDLTIAPGEVVALLGPNGAGKSTTVDMILGLTVPDSGTVTVFGREPGEAVGDGMIGAMLQGGALVEDLTVAETVGMVAALHREPMPVREALRRAGVEDLANRRSTRLSGGQKQRVRFAVALVSDPDLLILDEPTAAMDVGTRREFWKSMYEYTNSGRTVLFATHYLEEAEEFADRVVLMRSGRIVADGSVAQVRALAGGRTVRAVVPATAEPVIAGLPAVTGFELRGGRVAISSSDSDTTLRALLTRVPEAHDIEISAVGLEGAFLSLTTETTEEPVR